MKKWEQFSEDELRKLVQDSSSYLQLAEKIGYKASSGYINDQLKQMIEKFNFDTSHFGKDKVKTKIDNSKVTKKFWREKIKQRGIDALGGKCCGCGEVFNICCYDFHHLEPDKKDFAISAKQTNGAKTWNKVRDELKKCALLCANCHRLVHNGYMQIENKQYFNDEYYNWNLAESKQIDHVTMEPKDVEVSYICPSCGKQKGRQAELCRECSDKKQIRFDITRQELKDLIYTTSFSEIGRMFHVDGNSIKKRCKRLNLPFKKSEILKYSEEEWKNI